MPTKIHFGNKSFEKLESIVKEYDLASIFLITGKNFTKKTKLYERTLNLLKNYNVFVYDRVNPVPKLEEVNEALKTARLNNASLIIGLGGGSVLDTAKIISVMIGNEENLLDYSNDKKIDNAVKKTITDFCIDELSKIHAINSKDILDTTVIKMPKAYPAYFGTYSRFQELKEYIDCFENLFLVGRNGMHKYNNQDHSMLTAMDAVENIKNNITSKDNIWAVNTEEDYHEENSNK